MAQETYITYIAILDPFAILKEENVGDKKHVLNAIYANWNNVNEMLFSRENIAEVFMKNDRAIIEIFDISKLEELVTRGAIQNDDCSIQYETDSAIYLNYIKVKRRKSIWIDVRYIIYDNRLFELTNVIKYNSFGEFRRQLGGILSQLPVRRYSHLDIIQFFRPKGDGDGDESDDSRHSIGYDSPIRLMNLNDALRWSGSEEVWYIKVGKYSIISDNDLAEKITMSYIKDRAIKEFFFSFFVQSKGTPDVILRVQKNKLFERRLLQLIDGFLTSLPPTDD
jgi:hypothetical protein